MTDTIEMDLESASEINLTTLGLDRYRSHRSTRVSMAAYALNGGPWRHWEAHHKPFPAEAREALEDPEVEKWSFNAQFERVMTRDVLGIDTPIKGWRCIMVLAGLQGFNGGLEVVGEHIGLSPDKQKLKHGKQLIKTFCEPQTITKANPHRWRDHTTDPELWQTFCEYNVGDCVAARAVKSRLLPYPVPAEEWELYELDQEINDEGLPVDLTFVRYAIEMSTRRKAELTSQMIEICGLDNPGSVTQLLPWLKREGYWFDDLQMHSVEKVLAIDKEAGFTRVTSEGRAILELRTWQARLSVKKYDALLQRVGLDGQLRYAYLMAGAGRTARWAGRGVQTQNLKKTPKSLEIPHVLDEANRIIRSGSYDALGLFIDEPMEVLTGCVRSSFRVPDDEDFVIADLASIETAVAAILTGCVRLLGVFKAGLDPYKDFGTEFYQKAYDLITRWERNVCKPPTLGCVYRLSGGELVAGKRTGLWGYAEDMGVDMTREDAHRGVKVFRTMYPEIPVYWKALENAVERTLDTHRDSTVGLIRFEYRKPYLLAWLPTGRPIYYFKPQMKMRTVHTGRMIERRSRGMFEDGAPAGEMVEVEDTYQKRSFTYMAQHQKTRKWIRIDSHGGRTTEQVTQATAREVLKRGLLSAGRAGFRLCGHSHDEAIARVKKGDNWRTLERLCECMTESLPEILGLPLKAAGYVNSYYKKD